MVPNDDPEADATEALGLRSPLDHPSYAKDIDTSRWIARSMSLEQVTGETVDI